MSSLSQSLIVLFFSFSTLSTYANRLSPTSNLTPTGSCPNLEPVTVTVTVTAPASGYDSPASNVLKSFADHTTISHNPHRILSKYESCFDRNIHSYEYSYHHDEFHFSPPGSTSNAERPNTKASWIEDSPKSALATSSVATSHTSIISTKASPVASLHNISSPYYSSYNNVQSNGTRILHTSYQPTAKTASTTHPNSNRTSSFYTAGTSSAYANATSTLTALPTKSANPDCQPTLQLDGASEYGFNKKSAAFSVNIVDCSKFDVSNTTAFANFAPIDGIKVTPESISFPGLTADYVLLSIFALDTNGNAVLKSYQLHFGDIDMPILILGHNDQPAEGVLVYGNATIYPGISQTCTTDASGHCSLTNLPPTTIGLVAKTDSNSIAVDGLASTTTQVTLKLLPFTQPNGDSSFDINNGTSGWSAGTVSQSLKIKRDTTLTVNTNGQYDLQSASNSFNVHPFTKTVYIKYKFITSEVPGGYFGTQFNDYYSVTIRSDTGASVTVTNSMNALGLGAFDAGGATDWFTLSLKVPVDTKSVQYDIGVSNVADNLLDSSIVIDKVGDLQCDKCGDCDSCPSDPMCQSTCLDPPSKSCDFYRNCAEGQLGCGNGGYPLAYGEKNCNRFVNNLNYFTASGQDWIFNTMHCLQTAMVPVLKPCTATCPSFETAAFDSHPGCYVDSGFCGLQCPDVLAVMMTVNTDLISLQSLKQVVQTSGLCVQNLIQTLNGCGGDVVFGVAAGELLGAKLATKIAISVTTTLLSSVLGEFGL